MFISIFNFFSRYRITLFLILNAILIFSNQLHAQEESVIQPELVVEDQPDEKLIRVPRSGRRGPTPRRGSTPRTLTSVRNTSPIKKRSGSKTSPVGRHTANSRTNSPAVRSNSRKRVSPTKPKGSPPKQAKIAQKPVALPPGGRPVVYTPNPTESNDRYKLLRGIEAHYKTPFIFSTPPESAVGSRNFRLQWRTNGNFNAGMEHILKRHTREFHDGSFKKKQSMFPQGTTHVEIKDMVKQVAEQFESTLRKNTELGLDFRQIEGIAAHKGSLLPLVVGYRENTGQNKPLDVVQAYPKGIQYEVDVLPPPAREKRRASRRRSMGTSRDGLLEVLMESAALTADLMEAVAYRENALAEEEERKNLRDLVVDFSSEESQTQSISIMWGDNTNHPSSSLMDYTLLKNNYPIIQKNDLSDSPAFIDQPDVNALTTYLIKCKDKQNNESSSATLTVGAEKITNLKATISSDNKIILNWSLLDKKNTGLSWDPVEVNWAVFRNGEIIDMGEDANSFEDSLEPNQVYIYRIMAFIQENEPWNHQRHAIFYSESVIVNTEKTEDFEQDSFSLHTYLLSEPVTDLEDLGQNPDAYYTSIEDKDLSSVIVQSSITPWKDNTPVEMVDGRIDVKLNGHSLVPFTHFDNVRILWDYLLAMVEQYLQTNQATIYFPDQPILISLKKKSQGLVEFQIDDKVVSIGEKKCLIAILQGAEQFFTLLNEVSMDKYSSLIEQIKTMQGQVNPLIRSSQLAPSTMQAEAKRIFMNRVLVSWIPSNKDVKNYEILVDEKSIITLPAYKRSYTHIFQPQEQVGRCVYKIISYDQNDTIMETKLVEIEIEEAYLQAQKIVPPDIELIWVFPGQDTTPIGYYQINRNGSYLGVTDSTSYRETPLAIGKYTYEIKALDHSMHSLAITPIIIEKIASNAIELQWRFSEQDNSLIKHYQIYRNNEYIKATEDTTYIDVPSIIGKYTYKIRAFDLSGKALNVQPLIQEIEVIQEDLPQKQPVEQAVAEALIKRTSANEVLLNWVPNGALNIKNYEVLINDESLAILPAETQKYTHNIQQTKHLGQCTYKLIAYDNEDEKLESYSTEFEITTPYLQVKKIVENVFELNWLFLGEDTDSIGFYNIYRNDTPVMQVSENTNQLTDTTLLAPGIYTYKVEPLDENGSSLEIQPAIKEIVVIKEEEPYLTAIVISSRIMGSNVIDLKWKFLEQNRPIAFYNISCDNSFLRQVPKEETEFTDITQPALGEHTYRVKALDENENIIEIKQITLTLDGSGTTIKTIIKTMNN